MEPTSRCQPDRQTDTASSSFFSGTTLNIWVNHDVGVRPFSSFCLTTYVRKKMCGNSFSIVSVSDIYFKIILLECRKKSKTQLAT